jgi:lipopolysaccharide assembly outer membrane protein LptD (OstA)
MSRLRCPVSPQGISDGSRISYFSRLHNARQRKIRVGSKLHVGVKVQLYFLRFLVLLLILTASAYAQVGEGATDSDTIAVRQQQPADTAAAVTALAGDTLFAEGDTLYVFPRKDAADTIVNYKARDSVVYMLDEKVMDMYTDADIDYGNTAIKAARIRINWDKATMHAIGVTDSSTMESSGTPVLVEGGETYRGEEMTYNFRTKQGLILRGETAIEDGFYLGERIKRASEGEYFVCDGKYTTCDNPTHRHYYFGAQEMKVVPDDVVIARPITLYIEDIPLFWFPFAVIPNTKGRTSGIMVPAFGQDARRGRYLMKGGYYLSVSDYWDLALTGDWYTKGGYLARADLRYALRYNFSGSVSASFGRQRFNIGNVFMADDEPATDWSLVINHNQELTPLSRLTANVNLLTNSYIDKYSNNLDELLRQTVYSSASYSTSWEGTNRSLSIGMQRDQNTVSGTSVMTLPDITFNQSQIYPFRSADGFGQEWYEMIGFNYSARALNRIEVKDYTVDRDTIRGSFGRRGMDHGISLIASPKLGYVTISPSFRYQERWYDQRIEQSFTPGDSLVRARDIDGFFALRTFSASVSASTKLYGMFQPNIFGIVGIRHTLQPSLSYQYNPDFSSTWWGYYQSYVDSTGREVMYDPYSGFDYRPGAVFGGVSRGESQSIGLNVSNIFEMKLRPREDDTTHTERKFQLFTLSADSRYNWVADSLRLSDINLSFRTSVQGILDLYGGATLSPYVFERARSIIDESGREVLLHGRKVDRFIVNEGQGLARLTNFSLNLSTSLSHEMFRPDKPVDADTGISMPDDVYSFTLPWNLSLGVDYNVDMFDPDNVHRRAGVRAGMSFSFTPSWHVSMNTYYDIINKEVGAPEINVRKDLHCWEMTFNWRPAGLYRSFYFVLRLKSPQLQDIKLEKRGSDRGVYGR